MRKWLVTACASKSPGTSSAMAITPMSASTTRMRRAIRTGAKCRGRYRVRPGGFCVSQSKIGLQVSGAVPIRPLAAHSHWPPSVRRAESRDNRTGWRGTPRRAAASRDERLLVVDDDQQPRGNRSTIRSGKRSSTDERSGSRAGCALSVSPPTLSRERPPSLSRRSTPCGSQVC
jgi:hypothetical protein